MAECLLVTVTKWDLRGAPQEPEILAIRTDAIDEDGLPAPSIICCLLQSTSVEGFTCGSGIVAFFDADADLKRLPASFEIERGIVSTIVQGPVVFVVVDPTGTEDSVARVLRIVRPLAPYPSTGCARPFPIH